MYESAKPAKYRREEIVTAFQWHPRIHHPHVFELDGRHYVLDTNSTKHYLRPGCWIVEEPKFATYYVVDEGYFPSMFAAVEVRKMVSHTEGMTGRERRRAGLAVLPR